MSWATQAIEQLLNGETVTIRPTGNSMSGLVESKQYCTIDPITDDKVLVKDAIVLCKVNGKQYLHLIKGVKNGAYLIGNNKGGINGWTARKNIFGILSEVK